MRLAFDAKRAFQNHTGLGHYSRTLITSLAKDFPQHEYYLMAPKRTSLFQYADLKDVFTVTPTGIAKNFKALWRSNWVVTDLKKLRINLYHGLSHEIPVGINKAGINSVVTIHDLIFERYPQQYNAIDVNIYRKKFRYACTHADKIIAISEQTKRDIMQFYEIPADKISVCYQSCNPAFQQAIAEEELLRIKNTYSLPDKFFLYVGSVIERKNLLTIVKGLVRLKGKLDIPLVVIGNGKKYLKQVKEFISQNGLQKQVIFLSEAPSINNDPGFKNSTDFPAIYQLATAMIYPSIFEGFGIPVLEALWSRLPVITSNSSCLPETGGDAAYYIDPLSEEEMADAMYRVAIDETLRNSMITSGLQQAQKFTPGKCAAAVMSIYREIVKG